MTNWPSSEYPGLYRYGMLMEAAAEIENQKAKTAYGHLPVLPDSVKPTVAHLLTEGATLERGLQTILDEQGRRDMWVEAGSLWRDITSTGLNNWRIGRRITSRQCPPRVTDHHDGSF